MAAQRTSLGSFVTARVLPFGDSVHRQVDLLLPWYVNGSLEGDDLATVRSHLAECSRCQRELLLLRDLHAACRENGLEPWPANQRAPEHRAGYAGALASRLWPRTVPAWARWVMAVQFVLVLGLGAWLVAFHDAPSTYTTLGAAGAPVAGTAGVVVVFEDGTAESQLRAVLRASGALAVDVPTQQGAYVLHVPPERITAVVERLRREPAVTMVEPLAARSAP